jgi:hypothetical protein
MHAKGPTVIATIDGRHEHEFRPKSNISRSLMHAPLADIEDRLNGGHYFFVDGELIDFRDRSYVLGDGFVHTDDAIEALWNTLGVSKYSTRQAFRRASLGTRMSTQSTSTGLFKVWSKSDIHVPAYNEGGRFTSQLSFAWNPFNADIRSSFELVRLICVNGMIGLTSWLNSRVPLVNMWQEHLDIAALQIQRKVEDKVGARMLEMNRERASLADLMLLQRHAIERFDAEANIDDGAQERLRTISRAVNPMLHLNDFYKPDVFADMRVAAQLPGHLTVFDAWNIATEMSSHTHDGGDSTDNGLQRLANRLVFDPENVNFKAARLELPPPAWFSSPEQAFFGEVAVH